MDPPERSSGRLSHPKSLRVWPTRPGLAAGMRFVFRVPVAERLLLGRSFHRTMCLATLATELPPCDRVQASTSVRSELLVDLLVQVCLAWELSLRDHSAAQRPAPSESTDCVDPADFCGSVCPLGVLGRRLSPAV